VVSYIRVVMPVRSLCSSPLHRGTQASQSGVCRNIKARLVLLLWYTPFIIEYKGGFPFSAKCRTIDFLRSLSFETDVQSNGS
jgi:hypothetical protein